MKKIWFIGLALISIVVGGCGDTSKDAGRASSEQASGSSAQTTASIVSGSYEDWCEEHQVPETACTRCDPSLIPAFKATQDWCEEHVLPESQCRDCNPNLVIARPPKPEGK